MWTIRRKLQIYSHLLKKFWTKSFCAFVQCDSDIIRIFGKTFYHSGNIISYRIFRNSCKSWFLANNFRFSKERRSTLNSQLLHERILIPTCNICTPVNDTTTSSLIPSPITSKQSIASNGFENSLFHFKSKWISFVMPLVGGYHL